MIEIMILKKQRKDFLNILSLFLFIETACDRQLLSVIVFVSFWLNCLFLVDSWLFINVESIFWKSNEQEFVAVGSNDDVGDRSIVFVIFVWQ